MRFGQKSAKEYETGAKLDAFTLTEMLVVLVIIGLIAAIVGPRLFTRLDDAKRRTAHLQLTTLSTAIDLFRIDVGRLPTQAEGLDALVRAPAESANWFGPYLARDQVPLDPWRHAYLYKIDQDAAHYHLTSLGSDGREGGEGAAADISLDENAQDSNPTAPARANPN